MSETLLIAMSTFQTDPQSTESRLNGRLFPKPNMEVCIRGNLYCLLYGSTVGDNSQLSLIAQNCGRAWKRGWYRDGRRDRGEDIQQAERIQDSGGEDETTVYCQWLPTNWVTQQLSRVLEWRGQSYPSTSTLGMREWCIQMVLLSSRGEKQTPWGSK